MLNWTIRKYIIKHFISIHLKTNKIKVNKKKQISNVYQFLELLY